jgi:hypothetical protein
MWEVELPVLESPSPKVQVYDGDPAQFVCDAEPVKETAVPVVTDAGTVVLHEREQVGLDTPTVTLAVAVAPPAPAAVSV